MNCYPRKMVLYSSTKFRIIKPSTNIPWLRGFDLGFWKSSKQIYRKLQNKENFFGEFQGLPCFPRKMVLYLWTKFVIIKPWSIIQSLGRFHFGLWQTSNKFIGNSSIGRNFLESSKVCLAFPEKWFCICRSNLPL